MLLLNKLLALLCLLPLCSASGMVVQHARTVVPRGFTSQGPAPAEESITLRIALASANMAGLQQKLLTISDPSSPEYGQWLSKDQVKSFVQPTSQTVAAVSTWAKANGLQTQAASPNGEWLSFTVPISKANSLFDAKYTTFTHDGSSTKLIRTLSFSLPTQLVGHVKTVHPTTSFSSPDVRLAPPMQWSKRKAVTRAAGLDPSCNSTITPSCLEGLYALPLVPALQKKKNGLYATGYVDQWAQEADLQQFIAQFQKRESPNTTFSVVSLDGGENIQDPELAGIEANLDIQYTAGLAVGVPTTFLTVGGEFEQGLLDTTSYLSTVDNPPTVVTTSYGENEEFLEPSLAQQICDGYMTAGARGISILFASGDGGVRGGHDDPSQCPDNTFIPVFPAGCPWLTSVGSTIGINPERAINFTGGGFSNYFPRPAYQDKTVSNFLSKLPPDFPGIFNKSGRGYPDVAFQGWNFEVVDGGETGLVGGTSASSPGFASVVSLINDRLLDLGRPPLGFLNPFLYGIGSSGLTDITIGKNPGFTCDDSAVAFSAVKGWDPVTGWGTPVYPKLLAAALLHSF